MGEKVDKKAAEGNETIKDRSMVEKFQRLALVGRRQVMRAVVRVRRCTSSTFMYDLLLLKIMCGRLRRGLADWESAKAAAAKDKQVGLPAGHCSQTRESTALQREEAKRGEEAQLKSAAAGSQVAKQKQQQMQQEVETQGGIPVGSKLRTINNVGEQPDGGWKFKGTIASNNQGQDD